MRTQTKTAFTPVPFETIVGRNIDWQLTRHGITIERLAEWFGTSEGYVCDQLHGLQVLTAHDIVLLSQLFWGTCDTLLDTRVSNDDGTEVRVFWR